MSIYEIIKEKFLGKEVEISFTRYHKTATPTEEFVAIGKVTEVGTDGDSFSGYGFYFTIDGIEHSIDLTDNEITIL